MTHRWMKFWPQDWQSDPGLRSCSMAARGLWIECIAIMHRAEPYGHLSVNGVAPSAKRLAGMVGATEREVDRLLAELRDAGVFSTTPEGIIYSRRMVRDARASQHGGEEIEKRWGASDGKSRAQRLAEAREKGRHTPIEWEALRQACGPSCLKCGETKPDIVKDHIVPIYQGGSDSIDNIQPLCRSCNAAKGPDVSDLRPRGWRDGMTLVIRRLGPSEKTPSLEAEADTEAEKNPPTPRKRGSAKSSHPAFRDFWAAYPRKVGRGAAEKAFAAAIAKGASVADIAAGLNRQSWPVEPRFVPHPATWLNQARWQDDPAAAAPPSAEPERAGKLDWLWRDIAQDRAPDDFPQLSIDGGETIQ